MLTFCNDIISIFISNVLNTVKFLKFIKPLLQNRVIILNFKVYFL